MPFETFSLDNNSLSIMGEDLQLNVPTVKPDRIHYWIL